LDSSFPPTRFYGRGDVAHDDPLLPLGGNDLLRTLIRLLGFVFLVEIDEIGRSPRGRTSFGVGTRSCLSVGRRGGWSSSRVVVDSCSTDDSLLLKEGREEKKYGPERRFRMGSGGRERRSVVTRPLALKMIREI